MAAGYDAQTLRRALAIALHMAGGRAHVLLNAPDRGLAVPLSDLGEVTRLRAIVAALAFEPLPDGVTTRAEALHVLGFPPESRPDAATARARLRALAAIHHPDSDHGSHARMSQLNAAMKILGRAAS